MSGDVLSSFHLQDDIAKWEDMYEKFEIQNASKDCDEKGCVVYAYRLAKILQSEQSGGPTEVGRVDGPD